MIPIIRFHTAYLGHTGYAAHARGLIRAFKKYFGSSYDIRVRNCSWSEDLSYLDELDYSLLEKITFTENNYSYDINAFEVLDKCNKFDNAPSNVDIILLDQQNIYYYSDYDKGSIKIAYLVWESTEIIHDFFDIIKKWDYFFVATPWHKEILEKSHNVKHSKIFIVPEGLNEDIINYRREKNLSEDFVATFFGRWDYRKSLQEILWSFIEEFPQKEYPNIKINLSCNNPFSSDGMRSTEERLIRYGINDDRINILDFLSREEYLETVNNSNVFLNCARAEGWNIPLFEAISLGVPVTYCDYGAPKFFTQNCPGAVKFKYLEFANRGYEIKQGPNFPGYYCEPDFDDFKKVLRNIYNKKSDIEFLNEIKHISNHFKKTWTWYNSAEKLKLSLESILSDTYLIIAHCDTDSKIEILKNCIKHLNTDNFFIASYLDPIEDLKNNWIRIEDNPVRFLSDVSTEDINKINWPLFSHKRGDYIYQDYFYFIHQWSAWKLTSSSLQSLNLEDKKLVHVINYDYYLKDINIHKKELNRFDAVFYKWRSKIDIENKIDWNLSMINGAFFSGKYSKIKSIFESLNEDLFYEKYSFYEQALSDIIFKKFLNVKILDSSELDNSCFEWDIISRKISTFKTDKAEIDYCLYREDGRFFINLISDSEETLNINNEEFILEKNVEVDIEVSLPLLITKNDSKLLYRHDYNVIGRRVNLKSNK